MTDTKQANYMVVLTRGPEFGESMCSIHETIEAAELEAKRKDSMLTDGEKIRLGMTYVVRPLSGKSTYSAYPAEF